MNATQTPAGIISKLIAAPELPSGPDERFALYGVMGLPSASGHILALRDAPAASIGPAWRSDAKIGVANRVGASLYALQNGLAASG